MISRRSFSELSRVLFSIVPILCGALLLTGCDDKYPTDLQYPLRDDPLVIAKPTKATLSRFDGPGDLYHILDDLVKDEQDRKNIKSPEKLDSKSKTELEQKLNELFGTPLKPKVGTGDADADAGKIEDLQLDAKTLAEGSRLYRLHCLHCHGLTGNGRGPTAPWVNPHPRDYRQGVFKFTSSNQGPGSRKPRRGDLIRTIREGLDGTTMPSFVLLPEDQLQALSSYVTHLSIRGQTEFQVMVKLLQDDLEGEIADEATGAAKKVLGQWAKANQDESAIKPLVAAPTEKLDESVKNGARLFRDIGCLGCHEDFGRRESNSMYRFDDWGTIVRPANLTQGTFRGGRRPIDLYYRLHSGINGVNMPAPYDWDPQNLGLIGNMLEKLSDEKRNALVGKEKQDAEALYAELTRFASPDQLGAIRTGATLTQKEKNELVLKVASLRIWDMVNFIEALPYASMREQYGIEIHADSK